MRVTALNKKGHLMKHTVRLIHRMTLYQTMCGEKLRR